jgi:hypothetical protein
VHGWGATTPARNAWIEHLRAQGSAVVYPRYQDDAATPAAATVGLRRVFERPELRGRPVVAVGYTWGGKLVFDWRRSTPSSREPASRSSE